MLINVECRIKMQGLPCRSFRAQLWNLYNALCNNATTTLAKPKHHLCEAQTSPANLFATSLVRSTNITRRSLTAAVPNSKFKISLRFGRYDIMMHFCLLLVIPSELWNLYNGCGCPARNSTFIILITTPPLCYAKHLPSQGEALKG